MATSFNHTILAYLLALKDFPNPLDETERSKLKKVWKQYKIQPKAWDDYIEPDLIQIIQGNSLLNQFYQQYKNALDNLGEIPDDLLPTRDEINQLTKDEATVVHKGLPEDDNLDALSPSGYEEQINNVVIAVNQNEKPEEAVKQLGFLDKVKQLLN